MPHTYLHDLGLAILAGWAPSPLIGPEDRAHGVVTMPQRDETGTKVVRTARYEAAFCRHLAAKHSDDSDRRRAADELHSRRAHGERLRIAFLPSLRLNLIRSLP
jgi:hypothetical protein